MVCLSIHVEDLQCGLFVHTCWRIYSVVCLCTHVGGSTVWFVCPHMLEDLYMVCHIHNSTGYQQVRMYVLCVDYHHYFNNIT